MTNGEYVSSFLKEIVLMLRWWITIERGTAMDKMIKLPTVSEILKEEFMGPYGISQYKLAKETGVPVSRIQDILHNRRKVTPDTSLRLGIYFGVSEKYFLNIQMDLDIRELKNSEKESIEKIVPITLTAAVI